LNLTFALRVVGVTELALAVMHLLLWRLFDWTREVQRLSPLTARVFGVHTFFVAFVVGGLGALTCGRPDLLTTPGDLARLLLIGIVMFWTVRTLAQPLVFDAVLLRGSKWRTPVRIFAAAGFSSYVAVYGWALARQFP
jgi:hypothetical protein